MTRQRVLMFVAFALATAAGVVAAAVTGNMWSGATAVLLVGIAATILSLGEAFTKQIKVDEAPKWIAEAPNLGEQKQRVLDHFMRLQGTLLYWKNDAAAHNRLHTSRVVWTLLSAVLLPVLVRIYDPQDGWSRGFMTLFTSWTGLIVALAYTFKSEQRYQGMRQQESDYYDLARRLLDFADPTDPNLKAVVDRYLIDADGIRQTARRVETGAPPSAMDVRGRGKIEGS